MIRPNRPQLSLLSGLGILVKTFLCYKYNLTSSGTNSYEVCMYDS